MPSKIKYIYVSDLDYFSVKKIFGEGEIDYQRD